jgi:hypothetical protein
MATIEQVARRLSEGLVIPACPLALTAQRKLDERRQRALFRYYLAAGAGGLAAGVHTTQFAIHDAKVGLFKPVLELAAEELRRSAAVPSRSGHEAPSGPDSVERPSTDLRAAAENSPAAAMFASRPSLGIAGVCGHTKQALDEAALARELGYEAGLLSLGALRDATEEELITHCRAVAENIPLFGFYLQPAVGGRLLPYSFWLRFAEIENVVAIKIAAFNRYQTLDVIRAMAEAGRDDIALYTGNDDNIVLDLLTPFCFRIGDKTVERRMVSGLLGHWAVWTRRAVELHAECRRIVASGEAVPHELLRRAIEVTDCNAAFFDAANNYAGCIPGLHEVLRRQGLLEGIWCLDPNETLSTGQREEIDRVCRAYPHLSDDEFLAKHRNAWLSD